MSRHDWSRRRFLRGLGGAALGLPFLESLGWRRGVRSEQADRSIYSVFVRQANGVAQEYKGYPNATSKTLYDEPERFWLRASGDACLEFQREGVGFTWLEYRRDGQP